MTTWISDDKGNRCSVGYWGSETGAKAALESLKDCRDCTNCSYCSRCSDCSYCSRCSDCSRCSRCSYLKAANAQTEAAKVGPPPVPIIADIHKQIYAAASAPGALNMRDVHTCEKTHCRGGWVIALAGPEGHALERFYNWELAAMLIYNASDPQFKINPARFYDENADALADMAQLAGAAS